ncbi:DUF1513 domain-containing protein [Marinobacter halotolerans]|uniref:DUF1513 domain-containing protein n=1 Tax=Marinobacter halotolerans TaxID=1569211 RepID=UPI00124947AC|nr:DUF1513 domain-containing protein [Marinobacter halotolerans]
MKGISRRQLCQFSLAGGALVSMPGCGVISPHKNLQPGVEPPDLRAGAIGLPRGGFAIRAINPGGEAVWQCPVNTRCHSGCRNPGTGDLVFVERRPGWAFHVLDAATGQRHRRIEAGKGEHFVGHGVFAPDGQTLYLPASRYEQGEGIIAVYDVLQGYRRSRTLELDGVGPHELKMHPDGRTLVVGLGGILTHPDYDRIKLNLDTMEPALLLMDRFSGDILIRFSPSHHQLSCRHLDVTPAGDIYAAYQYQGPLYETPPLVARYRKGQFTEIDFGTDVLRSLGNYIASIVTHPENALVAVTSPVGGTAVIFDGLSGKVQNTASLSDCAGIQALKGGDFLMSTGQGKLMQFGASGAPRELASQAVQWDHHLV